MEVKVQLVSRDALTGTNRDARTYGYINKNYITIEPASTPVPEFPFIIGVNGGQATQVTSFAEWVGRVMRGLTSLSSNSFVDAAIIASWSVSEEEAG